MADRIEPEAIASEHAWIDDWAAGLPEVVARRELARLMRQNWRMVQRQLNPPILIPESAFACAHEKAAIDLVDRLLPVGVLFGGGTFFVGFLLSAWLL